MYHSNFPQQREQQLGQQREQQRGQQLGQQRDQRIATFWQDVDSLPDNDHSYIIKLMANQLTMIPFYDRPEELPGLTYHTTYHT